MRSFSTAATASLMEQETEEVWFPLAKLDHADWAEPVFLVPNTEPIFHLGDVYQPFPFQLALPDEEEGGVPVLRWVADNVSREIIAEFRAASGFIDVRVVWIIASEPDRVQLGPLDLQLQSIEYDALTITGLLGVEPILEEQFGHLTMNPGNAPALF